MSYNVTFNLYGENEKLLRSILVTRRSSIADAVEYIGNWLGGKNYKILVRSADDVVCEKVCSWCIDCWDAFEDDVDLPF